MAIALQVTKSQILLRWEITAKLWTTTKLIKISCAFFSKILWRDKSQVFELYFSHQREIFSTSVYDKRLFKLALILIKRHANARRRSVWHILKATLQSPRFIEARCLRALSLKVERPQLVMGRVHFLRVRVEYESVGVTYGPSTSPRVCRDSLPKKFFRVWFY